jgi:hypothetical protein
MIHHNPTTVGKAFASNCLLYWLLNILMIPTYNPALLTRLQYCKLGEQSNL